MLRYPRQDDTQDETGISSSATIDDWFNFCREICVSWAEKHSEKLGGAGCTVEIYEAKIEKRKYNHDRLIKGHWIFGGYEQDTKKVFIVPVEDRTEQALLTCIKEWILPGTTIVSDCWKSHNLNNERFQYLKVNQFYNFVDFKTGANTQHVKRVWKEVRGNIPRFKTKEDHVLGHLCEYFFKRAYSRLERIETFFTVIAELYPPISISDDQLETSDQKSNTNTCRGERETWEYLWEEWSKEGERWQEAMRWVLSEEREGEEWEGMREVEEERDKEVERRQEGNGGEGGEKEKEDRKSESESE